MALPFLAEIERFITEHGSAAIMKERLELIRDKYSDLEEKLAAALAKSN